MSFLTGSATNSWQPVTTGDTTTSSYWLNWRFLLCTIWLLIPLVVTSILISKYEGGFQNSKNHENTQYDDDNSPPGVVYEDDVWRPCLKNIHPNWLLGFRAFAFMVLLFMLVLNIVADGGTIMYFYTQWTFALLTLYFGIGTVLSIYGCIQYKNKVCGGDERMGNVEDFDAEYGAEETAEKSTSRLSVNRTRKVAGFWGYLFQIIFQMNTGAVMLTDSVFWFVILPYLAINNYNLNFLIINMHSANAVFLLGETVLNSLTFPWFRIAYFMLWTIVYVVFQWVLHACISFWWPYTFLDLGSSLAPLWYLCVALMHIPCYGLFVLVVRMKHSLLSKWFPQTYQPPRHT